MGLGGVLAGVWGGGALDSCSLPNAATCMLGIFWPALGGGGGGGGRTLRASMAATTAAATAAVARMQPNHASLLSTILLVGCDGLFGRDGGGLLGRDGGGELGGDGGGELGGGGGGELGGGGGWGARAAGGGRGWEGDGGPGLGAGLALLCRTLQSKEECTPCIKLAQCKSVPSQNMALGTLPGLGNPQLPTIAESNLFGTLMLQLPSMGLICRLHTGCI